MGIVMDNDRSESEQMVRRARGGDSQALGELFERYRERLRQMVRLRLDRRLFGRIDPSDVLQEAYLDVSKHFPEYAANPAVPFLSLASLPHRAKARDSAPAALGDANAGRGPGGVALPGRPSAGILPVPGQPAFGPPDLSHPSGHTGRDADSPARSPQHHGPAGSGGAGAAAL